MRALIGQRVYPSWARATRLVCATVLPVVFVVLVIVYAMRQHNVWITIFRPIGITLTVAMYLLVAVTALYVAVDRAKTNDENGDQV